MIYLLDSNVFIQAKNLYYAPEICPGFWEWLDISVTRNNVRSIVQVYEELKAGNDELAEWIKERKDGERFLDTTDRPTQTVFRDIAAVVENGRYTSHAKAQFLSGADPWLVAKAKTIGATIVTHEKYDRNAKKRVLLPNICDELKVPSTDIYTLLRSCEARFIL